MFAAVQRLASGSPQPGTQAYQPVQLTVDGLEGEEQGQTAHSVVPVSYEMTEHSKHKSSSPRSDTSSSPQPQTLRWTSKRQQQRAKRRQELVWGTVFVLAMGAAGWALSGGRAGAGALGEMSDAEMMEYAQEASAVDAVEGVASVSWEEQYAAPDLSRFTEAFDEDLDAAEEADLSSGEGETLPATVVELADDDMTVTGEADTPAATTSEPVAGSSSPPGGRAVRTRVRARRHNQLYSGCSSSQLLSSLAQATIRADGASRANYTHPAYLAPNTLPPLSDFAFSYDLPGCPHPHVFTPAETCDLLSSFGGVYVRGDSLMRQFAQGVFLLLADSFDIVRDTHKAKQECAGNAVFTNGRECKFESVFDSQELRTMCGEEAYVKYDQVWKYVPEWYAKPAAVGKGERERAATAKAEFSAADSARSLTADYSSFSSALPAQRASLSPVYVHGTGIHYSYDGARAMRYHVDPFTRLANDLPADGPEPLKLFSLALAPGANKPQQFLAAQGPERAKAFNEDMLPRLAELNAERGETRVEAGAWGALDWFAATDGAASYDGTHYSYQVVMERAQVFLNLLDVVHAEIVAGGGLVAEEAEVETVTEKSLEGWEDGGHLV